MELFGCQQQLRGISKSLEESKERAEQLNVLKAATAAKTRDVRADVEVAERLLRERNLQVEFSALTFTHLAKQSHCIEEIRCAHHNSVSKSHHIESRASSESLFGRLKKSRQVWKS